MRIRIPGFPAKLFWVFLALAAGVVFLAAVFVLFATARLQKGLLTKQPQYSGQQLYADATQQIQKGQYAQAENYLEQALLKEDDATYRNQLAVVKYRLGKYQESVAQYQKLVDANQDAAFAWNGMGNAYRDWAAQGDAQKADRLQKARDAYLHAIQVDRGYTAAYSNLALLLNAGGDKAAALRILDQGLAATQGEDLRSVRASLNSP